MRGAGGARGCDDAVVTMLGFLLELPAFLLTIWRPWVCCPCCPSLPPDQRLQQMACDLAEIVMEQGLRDRNVIGICK